MDNSVNNTSTINISTEGKTSEEHTFAVRQINFADGVDEDTMKRVNSGRMNYVEYVRLFDAVFGDGIYTEERRKAK